MNKYLSVITKMFRPKTMTMLGRWRLEYNETIIKDKVYWANNDHCGPCGSQLTPKENHNNETIIEVREKEKDKDKKINRND